MKMNAKHNTAAVLIISFCVIISLFSCHTATNAPQQPDLTTPPTDSMKEALINNNRKGMQDESADIEAFAKRRNWDMEATGTGLRYQIYKQGTGNATPKKGDFVSVAFMVYLLDGTLCYKYDSDKPYLFQVSKSKVARGLEEGVMKMRVGDKARLLCPKHLGYGLVGDDKKIPANSILFYDVELLSIK